MVISFVSPIIPESIDTEIKMKNKVILNFKLGTSSQSITPKEKELSNWIYNSSYKEKVKLYELFIKKCMQSDCFDPANVKIREEIRSILLNKNKEGDNNVNIDKEVIIISESDDKNSGLEKYFRDKAENEAHFFITEIENNAKEERTNEILKQLKEQGVSVEMEKKDIKKNVSDSTIRWLPAFYRPAYGRYCGKGDDTAKKCEFGKKASPEACDELDSLCEEHDKCYSRTPYNDQINTCDNPFIENVKIISKKTKPKGDKHMDAMIDSAKGVYYFFKFKVYMGWVFKN